MCPRKIARPAKQKRPPVKVGVFVFDTVPGGPGGIEPPAQVFSRLVLRPGTWRKDRASGLEYCLIRCAAIARLSHFKLCNVGLSLRLGNLLNTCTADKSAHFYVLADKVVFPGIDV
jgi:hypothetical protein